MGRKDKQRARRKARGGGFKSRKDVAREAGGWPLRDCLINAGWRDAGMANVMVVREPPGGGHLVVASFLVDLGALGVKDASLKTRITADEIDSRIDHLDAAQGVIDCSIDFVAHLIEQANAWAARFGFEPHEEFAYASQLLGDADPGRSGEEIPLGRDGKPFVTLYPGDPDALDVLAQLERAVGAGNYHYIAPPQILELAVERGIIAEAALE